MNKVERVELESAPQEIGGFEGRSYFHATFKLTPSGDGIWSEIFRYNLEQFNQRKKKVFDEEAQESGVSEETDVESVWKFEKDEANSALRGLELICANCYSIEEIESLHEALKNIVRKTNDEYPKMRERLKAADAKLLEDQKRIQHLKKTLKTEV
jgi:hypothetical protein